MALLVGATVACDEVLPTASDPSLLPITPQSFEVVLSYEEFVDSQSVFGGFGTLTGLATAIAANNFDGGFTSHAVFRFEPIINRLFFADSAGLPRLDTLFTVVGGRITVEVDSSAAELDQEIDIAAGSMQTPWNPRTATWEFAVDTVNARLPWPEAGGGPVVPLGVQTFEAGDSIAPLVFEVDSVEAERLARGTDHSRGLLLQLLTDGAKLEFATATFEVEVRPSFLPDTTVFEPVGVDFLSLFFEQPDEVPGEFRVGGTPSRRSIFFMTVPDSVDGPEAVCGPDPCRVPITPETLNYAELLATALPGPPGFERTLIIPLDAREVLAPSLLPEAPLGPSLTGGRGIFITTSPMSRPQDLDRNVRLPLTDLLQAKFSVRDTLPGRRIEMSLMTQVEPFFFTPIQFAEGGTEGEPILRLLVTPPQRLRFR